MENKQNSVVVFVQARMGSTRLPGKILKEVLGKPLLVHQVERIRKAKSVDRVVVITSTQHNDDVVETLCQKHSIDCFRGSETDLLDRHYQAAKKYKADFVVKIPSDCPLTDPDIIDEVINLWKENPEKYDYVSNYHPATFPDGLDVEGCPFSIFEIAWREAKKQHEREHTFPFIWDQPDRFRIGNIKNPRGNMFLSHRWTLDYQEDFDFLKRVYEELQNMPDFRIDDVLALLRQKPDIARINQMYNGVNWYRNVEGELKTINRSHYKKTMPIHLEKSLALLERAKKVIPCATQTLSKGYTQWSVGASPLFLDSAKGCEVTDVDGNVYVDYGMALGPFILGYADPDVDAAVRAQLEKGTMFTLPHPLEVEAAELIVKNVPCAEMVRFGKNGSDATTAAIKVARAYTGRDKVISCGYHGWHDWFVGTTERDMGIPQKTKGLTFPAQYNDIDSFKKIIAENPDEIAAVIIEPVYVIEPQPGFLEDLRALTKKEGIVLIFDELFSGFRWSLGGAQEFFKVTPDLATFGKAIANGMPVSALAGKREIMEKFEDVFFSFTYGGETLSLAAIVATIKKLQNKEVYEHIWNIGTLLKENIQKLIEKHGLVPYVSILGFPVKTAFSFNGAENITPLEMKTYVQQECAERGVLFIGYHLPSLAHTEEHVTFTINVYDEVLEKLADAIKTGTLKKQLRGSVVTQIFKNVGDRSGGLKKE